MPARPSAFGPAVARLNELITVELSIPDGDFRTGVGPGARGIVAGSLPVAPYVAATEYSGHRTQSDAARLARLSHTLGGY